MGVADLATVVAVAPDLMFASRIDATLGAAGHAVTLAQSIAEADLGGADALVVDLDRIEPEASVGLGVPVLGFYSHTDAALRERADAAGVDTVVPRSRMAREMPELLGALLER